MKKIITLILTAVILLGGSDALAQGKKKKKGKKDQQSTIVEGRQKVRETDYATFDKFTTFSSKSSTLYYSPFDYTDFLALTVDDSPEWGDDIKPVMNYMEKTSRATMTLCALYAINPDITDRTQRQELGEKARSEAQAAIDAFEKKKKKKGMRNKTQYKIAEVDYRYFKGTNYYSQQRPDDIIHVGVILYFGSKKNPIFVPDTATTHTTSLGRTVYGGTVDVVSGTLTVTHALVDLGDLSWLLTGGTDGYFYATIPTLKNNTDWTVVPNLACEIYQTTYPDAIANKTIDNAVSTWKSGNRLIVRDTSYTDASAFKTAVSGQMLCYELAEPQTYTLTPQTINTLQGVNNVWADSGDCSIEYVRDIGLALDNLLPDSPTTDGTYTLVCTVTDGKATIAWQSRGASLSSPLSMSSPASLNINTTKEEGDSNEIR